MSKATNETATATPTPWEIVDDSSEIVGGVRFTDDAGWVHRLAFHEGIVATIVNTGFAIMGPVMMDPDLFGGFPDTAQARNAFGVEYARQLKGFLEADA